MIIQDLDKRCIKILEVLLNRDSYVTLQEIALFNNVSRRTIYYDLERINDFLIENKWQKIIVERGKGIYLHANTRQALSQDMLEGSKNPAFNPSDRVRIITCTILRRDSIILIEDLMDICKVSRNTIQSDLKSAQESLANYNLELEFTLKKGYYIKGNVITKRAVFFLCFDHIRKLYLSGDIELSQQDVVDEYQKRLHSVEKELNYRFVYGVCYSLSVFFATVSHRKDPLIFDQVLVMKIVETPEYGLIDKYFEDFSSFEKVYLTLHILGSRLQSLNLDFNDQLNGDIYNLACDLVEEFERIANVDFQKQKELEQALYYHLKNSIYRYRYGIIIGNPLLDDVKREYGYLFDVTKKATQFMQKELSLPIHDAEIAYLTLHFGGALNSQRKLTKKKKRILVICPNGLSTANMLKAEISYLIQDDAIIEITNSDNLTAHQNSYDVVISTIAQVAERFTDFILVNPVLSDLDRMAIMKKVYEIDNPQSELNDLVNIIKPYLKDDSLGAVRDELYRFLNYRQLHRFNLEEDSTTASSFLGQPDFVAIDNRNISWQQAIEDTTRILERKNHVTNLYAKNIVRQLLKYGPYMFIANGVCLAHSKISHGSLKLGLSLCVYPRGVEFERGKTAYLVFVMSAQDQTSHLKMLSDLIKLFAQEQNMEQVRDLKSVADINVFFENAI